jgi:hypothetical protein
MNKIVANIAHIAFCGLYCSACRSFLNNRCPGCQKNVQATWCSIRSCCIAGKFSSCADCKEFADPMECKKFNNLIARIFGFVFRSDRAACIKQIKNSGLQKHAEIMSEKKQHTIKR